LIIEVVNGNPKEMYLKCDILFGVVISIYYFKPIIEITLSVGCQIPVWVMVFSLSSAKVSYNIKNKI